MGTRYFVGSLQLIGALNCIAQHVIVSVYAVGGGGDDHVTGVYVLDATGSRGPVSHATPLSWSVSQCWTKTALTSLAHKTARTRAQLVPPPTRAIEKELLYTL